MMHNVQNDFAPDDINSPRSVFLALNRHQRRREQTIPTLSVLIGPPTLAATAWQAWVESIGWPPSAVRPCDGSYSVANLLPEATADDSPGRALLYLLAPAQVDFAEIIERLSRWLDALGSLQARSALALTLEPAAAAAYLRDEPYSRARTRFAEGIIELSSADGSRPGAMTVPQAPERKVLEKTDDDRARSAAERYLFDLLNNLPETRDLFELNIRLGFCFGPMPAEVDLLAASLRLVVEIDGFYHFREPEGYRRDRRKDALLQQQGYLVLRFLADDVVARAEDILAEIRAAVAFRRATL